MKPAFPLLLAFVVIASTTGCVDRKGQELGKQTKEVLGQKAIPVRVVPALGQSLPQTLDINGETKTEEDVSISSKISGRLAVVLVKEGDLVTKGQVVARLEGTEAYARLSQSQAGLANARALLAQTLTDASQAPLRSTATERGAAARLIQSQANLAKLKNGARDAERKQAQANIDRAQSDLDYADKAMKRAKRLFDQGALAQADLEAATNRRDEAASALESAKQQFTLTSDPARVEDIAAAEQQVRQAQEDLKNAQANKKLDPIYNQKVDAARANVTSAEDQVKLSQQGVADLTITAPTSGKIVGTPLQAGSVVNPGQAIARVVNLAGIFFDGEVSEANVAKIHPGMTATMLIDALPDLAVPGVVKSVDAVSSSTGRLFSVKVVLRDRQSILRQGMFGHATILLGTQEGAITVPTSALSSDGKSSYLYTVEGTKAKKVIVQVTGSVKDLSVVTGIAPNAKVVIRGQDTISDGHDVVIDTEPPVASEGSRAGSTTTKGA